MKAVRGPALLATFGIVFLLSGCFSYAPESIARVSPGDRIRISLIPADVPMPPSQPNAVFSGTVLERAEGRVLLQVPVSLLTEGVTTRILSQEVEVEIGRIAWLERRRFNRSRTAVAIAGGIMGAVFLINSFGDERPVPEMPRPPGDEEAGARLGARAQVLTVFLRPALGLQLFLF